jgi:hypothetical protein
MSNGITIGLSEPSIGVVLTASRSQFITAPHHAHFSVSDSTFSSGGVIHEASIHWSIKNSSGTEIANSFAGPEIGHVFSIADTYTVSVRMRPEGTSRWYTANTTFEVTTAVYQAECYVDLDNGVNGTGSAGSPFNNMASAISYINTNWVAGATNEHAIHVKKGTSETLGAGLGNLSNEGRLVIDAYGTGARPILNLGGAAIEVVRGLDDFSLAMIGININGGQAYPPSVQGEPFFFISNESNTPAGFNTIFLDCRIENCGGSLYWAHGSPTAAGVINGYYDFVAIAECEFSDNAVNYFSASADIYGATRYFLDTSTSGRTSSFGIRIGAVQHAYIRHTQSTGSGSNVSFRLHAKGVTGIISNYIVMDRCTFLKNIWIMPDDGGGSARDMKNVWICDSYFQAWSGEYVNIDLFVNDGLVFRNNVLRSNGISAGGLVSFRQNDDNRTSSVNWWVENNTFINLFNQGWASSMVWDFQGWSGTTQTDITFRNNLIVTPNVVGGSNIMFNCNYGSPSPTTMFSACDGNCYWTEGGSVTWANGFSTGNGSLATWQSQTPFDHNSISNNTSGNPLVWVTGGIDVPYDPSLTTDNFVIGMGQRVRAAWVDYRGLLRPSAGKSIGAYEYGNYDRPPVL